MTDRSTFLVATLFETTGSARLGVDLPDFRAGPGTELFAAGWRERNDLMADGPGSGIHGIERNGVLCLIAWERSAHVDDDDVLVESDTLELLVQCTPSSGSTVDRADEAPPAGG